MKRLISVFLTMSILLACFALPVLADEVDSNWFNILDYGYCYNYSTNYVPIRNTTTTVRIDSAFVNTVWSYDILFYSDAKDIVISGASDKLNIVSLGNNLYRAYGLHGSRDIYFTFTCSSGTYIDVISFSGSFARTTFSPIDIIFGGFTSKNGPFITKHFTNTEAIAQSFTLDSYDEVVNIGYFGAELHFTSSWQKYDFIDVCLANASGDIDSIEATIDGIPLPVTVTPILGDSTDKSLRMFNVRIDLRNANRSSTGYPFLYITGNGNVGLNEIAILSSYGSVLTGEPSVISYWFMSIFNWLNTGFSSVISAITSSTDAIIIQFGTVPSLIHSVMSSIESGFARLLSALASDQDSSSFQDQLNSSLGQLGQAGAAMDSIARPNIGSVDLNVTSRIPISGMNALASVVNVVYENEVLGPLMWMFFTLSLGAFVLFGRS